MDAAEESTPANAWSVPPRRVQNHTLDSTRWHDFRFRPGDVVIASWAKAGTSWVQQIVGQLIFDGDETVPTLVVSPWIEHRAFSKRIVFEMLETQRHRRFVKSHLPADALVYSRSAKYIYIGRDGRDVIWSWYQHHKSLRPEAYEQLNAGLDGTCEPLSPPAPSFEICFRDWLDRDGFPLWPFWSHVRSWWALRYLPNVLLVHFNDLKADLPGQIRAISEFLEQDVSEEILRRVTEHSSFEYMKRNASRLSPFLDTIFVNGAGSLVNRGKTGAWAEVLSEADLRKYQRAVETNLSPDCAAWLESGGPIR